jgi:hypothetical protein
LNENQRPPKKNQNQNNETSRIKEVLLILQQQRLWAGSSRQQLLVLLPLPLPLSSPNRLWQACEAWATGCGDEAAAIAAWSALRRFLSATRSVKR